MDRIAEHIQGSMEMEKVSALVSRAKAVEINTTADVDLAGVFLSEIKEIEKVVEDKRITFTKPMNESLKNINASFKLLSEPLVAAKAIIKSKILAWRQAEHEKEMAELKRLKEEADTKAALNEALDLPEEEFEPIRVQTLDNKIGNTQVRKTWEYAIIDFGKVPDEFKVLNHTEVMSAIRTLGMKEIPGLKIFQSEQISIIKR